MLEQCIKFSIILQIYNEEKRIYSFLNALRWCNDIIIINKSSSDSSKEICNKFSNVTIITAKFTETGAIGISEAIKLAKHNWIMPMTISDFIDYTLACDIQTFISKDTKINTLIIPFNNYILGLNKTFSPWYTKEKRYVFNKNSITISDNVHTEIIYDVKNEYKLQSPGSLYHLTHQSIESQFERHIRYTKREAEESFLRNVSCKRIFLSVCKTFLSLLFKKKVFFHGEDGIALGFSYLMYFMMKYLFLWEKKQNIEQKYQEIIQRVTLEFEEKK